MLTFLIFLFCTFLVRTIQKKKTGYFHRFLSVLCVCNYVCDMCEIITLTFHGFHMFTVTKTATPYFHIILLLTSFVSA